MSLRQGAILEAEVKTGPRSLKANLAILGELTRTDLKVRFQGSVLGYIWTLLKPLAIFSVLYVIFTYVWVRFDVPYFGLRLLLGIIIWSFLSDCTLVGMNAFLSKPYLVTKVYVPRVIIVASSTLVSVVLLLLQLVVFLGFYFAFGPKPGFNAPSFVFYVVALYVITLGLTLPLSVLIVRLRDLQHIWEVVLQMGFWLTPIIWDLGSVTKNPTIQRVIMLNPMARIIEFSRHALLDHTNPGAKPVLVLTAMVGVTFLMGYLIFKKLESHVAEQL